MFIFCSCYTYDCSVVVFFVKEKTGYEMRICDLSSDVCSSDPRAPPGRLGGGDRDLELTDPSHRVDGRSSDGGIDPGVRKGRTRRLHREADPGERLIVGRIDLLRGLTDTDEHRGGGWQGAHLRSEEHTSELQSLMRISYDVFCLKKKKSHMLTRY